MRDPETKPGERVKDVHFTAPELDGSSAGYGIHWPDIDEDLTSARGTRWLPVEIEPQPPYSKFHTRRTG